MNIPNTWRILLSTNEIDKVCDRIAKELNEKFKTTRDIVLVGILKGCVPFFTELSYRLHFEHTWQFIEISSYATGMQTSPKFTVPVDLNKYVGKTIILVDELCDSGATLKFAADFFKKSTVCGPVFTCVAFKKNRPTVADADFQGLVLPDVWLAGFGLDEKQKFRNIKAIYALPCGNVEFEKNYKEIVKSLEYLINLD